VWSAAQRRKHTPCHCYCLAHRWHTQPHRHHTRILSHPVVAELEIKNDAEQQQQEQAGAADLATAAAGGLAEQQHEQQQEQELPHGQASFQESDAAAVPVA
jgi:hypothetical protein